MKVCIVGAGAVGGLLGGKLANAGQQVTLIDQGNHLKALQARGLHLVDPDGTEHRVDGIDATSNIEKVTVQDLVILAVKAHEIAAVAPGLPVLYGPETVILTLQNGLPWWYFYRHGGSFDGRRIDALDPDGLIAENIPAERVIGCVAYAAAERVDNGTIRHVEGDRFPVGELDGSDSPRLRQVAELLEQAGLRSRVLDDIRAELWLKALGSLSINPISALTGATMVDICRRPDTRVLVATMMEEGEAVAHELGITFRRTIEERIAGAEKVGTHKTSMLQDVEAGRELELEALVGSVIELGTITGTPTPSIEAVYACTKLMQDVYMSPLRRVRAATPLSSTRLVS